jgi:3-oxoacyl-[acyl-carrier-protein] synthase II
VSKPNLALLKTQCNFFSEAFFPYELSRQLYKIFKLRGPVQNITAACATGTNSPILAAQWIRHGVCDLVLAGAVESSLHPLYFAGFDQMGVLARSVVCPFDKRRQGFALGEGAGIFVLERKDHALMRGARIYGEITGWAMANDASHAVAFGRSGSVIAEAIARALQRAGRDRVDYINAHGTATPLNDIIETRAIKKAFGARAGSISLSSTKAATGHLLGASGAVEFAFSLLALRDQIIPPTLNLCEPDSECDLDYTPQHVRMATVESVMSLSFGFGGQIGVIAATR